MITALMPIEDIDGEYNEPLSGGSDQTYQSSTSNMFDPRDVGEDGLATRDGDWVRFEAILRRKIDLK